MKAIISCVATLALAACATTTQPAPKNAATSSAHATGQPRTTDEDVSWTSTTSAEIRAEQQPQPKAAPEPRHHTGGPESLPDPNPMP